MLGWEYPPHISGGLGTACEGLSKALANDGVKINFVVPHLFGDEEASHMNLHSCSGDIQPRTVSLSETDSEGSLKLTHVPSLLSPYLNEESYAALGAGRVTEGLGHALAKGALGVGHYGRDIFEEVNRYTSVIGEIVEGNEFQVIHAHDWMTYPAAVAAKHFSEKPLVVHAHSLEFDRAGENGNQRIMEVERYGLQNADKVIAVSHYTASIVNKRYGVPLDKLEVVHNGIGESFRVSKNSVAHDKRQKLVVYLGRVTFQKGPDWFVRCAEKVARKDSSIKFALAGSGDMLPSCIAMAKEAGLEKQISFPGFLKGPRVKAALANASMYMMPSVSEPFGISALEAASLNTPALISKQSGVGEVLRNTLRADFWDTDLMAEYVVTAMKHQELREDLASNAAKELEDITWDHSSVSTRKVYNQLV